MASLRTWMTLINIAGIAAAGCGLEPAPAENATGQMTVALTATAGSATYFLQHAVFDIAGPTQDQLNSDLGTLQDQLLSAQLPIGRYQVTLGDEWQLVRDDTANAPKGATGPVLVPVRATLLSPNPVTVSVFSSRAALVTFVFEANGMPITFAPGAIDVGVEVQSCDPQAPAGSELNVVGNPDFEVNADGWINLEDGSSPVTSSDDAHCGLHSGQVSSASGGALGVGFDLPSPGTQTTYAFSAWVKHHASTSVGFIVRAEQSGGPACDRGSFTNMNADAVPPGTWQRLTGSITAGGPNCLRELLSIESSSSDLTGLLVDDVYAVPQ